MMYAQADLIAKLSAEIASIHTSPPPDNALPSEVALANARSKLQQHLPSTGLGLERTVTHLQRDIVPGLNASSRSSSYYGFVTGGSTPAASLADNIVTAYDQNCAVHLPNEAVTIDVEDRALTLLAELLKLDPAQWPHRIFTSGATGSNILGIACGREYVIAKAAAARSEGITSVGEIGIFDSLRRAGVDQIQILTTAPHSSLVKAAGVLGLGRASVIDVSLQNKFHKFDILKLKKLLEAPRTASIVAVSACEVNSGLFATSSLAEMQELRKLADMYGGWIHVDGAMGLMGRILDSSTYQGIIDSCTGLELADSLTGDGHKLLNVPYDCGFFFSRHHEIPTRVFQNPNAAYLAAGPGSDSIMSPLNIGLENSRRFRALPVYASLAAYGRDGYRDMLERQVELSRGFAEYIHDSKDFELLPKYEGSKADILNNIFMIVLFRAKDEGLNKQLTNKIKETRKIYASGTAFEGKLACRLAVSNWMADVKRDLPIIKEVLNGVVAGWKEKQ